MTRKTVSIVCSVALIASLNSSAQSTGNLIKRDWWTELQPSKPNSPPGTIPPTSPWIGLVGEINKWAPYVALQRQREAAYKQADELAKSQIQAGVSDVIISIWQQGGQGDGSTLTPLQGMGAVVSGVGNSFEEAMDQAFSPQIWRGNSNVVEQIHYHGGAQISSNRIALSEYSTAVIRGRAQIDRAHQDKIDKARADQMAAEQAKQNARSEQERAAAITKAQDAARERTRLEQEQEERDRRRKDMDEIKQRILDGAASDRDRQRYTDEWDRHIREAATARCAQNSDTCNPCPACRTGFVPEILVYDRRTLDPLIRAAPEKMSKLQEQFKKLETGRGRVR